MPSPAAQQPSLMAATQALWQIGRKWPSGLQQRWDVRANRRLWRTLASISVVLPHVLEDAGDIEVCDGFCLMLHLQPNFLHRCL
jgi:hypothetical protein